MPLRTLPGEAVKRDSGRLRKKAEKKLGSRADKKQEELSPAEAGRIIHELKVHQIELEMQNEELRRAQAELEESRSRYADLYDFAPIGYFTFDKNGLVVEANLTGASMLGIERTLLLKKTFSRFIVKQYQDEFSRHRMKVLDTSERQTAEVKIRNEKGAEFYARLESIPFVGQNGRKIIRTSVIDVTERRLAQTRLIQAEKVSAMGMMAGSLAHELNSPLSGIMPMIQKYLKEADKDSTRHMELSLIMRACEHMTKIISDFNSFSRKTGGEPHELNLNNVIESTLSFSATLLKIKGIQIIKKYKDDLPCVRADRTELQQVVLNMITNAGDAMPEGGAFVIRTGVAEGGKSVIMEFIDEGTGVEKKIRERIFDPLFSTKGPDAGTGLGLSISSGIIEKYGGKIELKKRSGKGAGFRISLPAV